MNIVLIGIMGAGKTTVGKILSERLNRTFIDTDDYVVKKNNMSIKDMFDYGEEYFRKCESDTIKDVSQLQDAVISCGGGIIKKKENIDCLKENGCIVYIDRPIESILNDINVEGRPLLKSGKDNLYKLYNERRKLYELYCDYHIKNESSAEHCADDIIREMNLGKR